MRAGAPALLLFFGMLLLPDTPNSLAERDRPDQARRVLERIRGTSRVDNEMESIITAVEKGSKVGASLSASHMPHPLTKVSPFMLGGNHALQSMNIYCPHDEGRGHSLCLSASGVQQLLSSLITFPGCCAARNMHCPQHGVLLVQAGNAWRLLFSAKLRPALVVSASVAFFSQINVRPPPMLPPAFKRVL